MKEIVICAAVVTEDGYIVRGHRHHHCFRAIEDMGKVRKKEPDAMGFITSHNRYVTRQEGRRLQDAAGIASVAPGGYRGDSLYSEDLY